MKWKLKQSHDQYDSQIIPFLRSDDRQWVKGKASRKVRCFMKKMEYNVLHFDRSDVCPQLLYDATRYDVIRTDICMVNALWPNGNTSQYTAYPNKEWKLVIPSMMELFLNQEDLKKIHLNLEKMRKVWSEHSVLLAHI